MFLALQPLSEILFGKIFPNVKMEKLGAYFHT